MQITVQYAAQVKAAAGSPGCILEMPENAHAEDVVRRIAAEGSDELRRMLIDGQGAVHATLLLFVGDEIVSRQAPRPLRDGETLAIMSPISGG